MTTKKKWLLGVYSLIAGIVFGLLCFVVTPLYHLLHGLGWLSGHETVKYHASNEANLKALRIALLAYHESEGQFPDSRKWMDAIKTRVRADNMAEAEAMKKFVNPLYPAKAGVFGYAMNDAASNKYKGDLKDPKMPLIFDSSDTAWDAHGDPAKLKAKSQEEGGNEAVAVDGTILRM